jgi:outer membrane protein TolC
MLRKFLIPLAISGITGTLFAQDVLDLDDAISQSIENNFTYRIARIDPEIAREQVTAESAAFDTEIFLSGEVAQSKSADPESSSDQRRLNAGATKRLVHGTRVTASTALNRSDTRFTTGSIPLSQDADFSLSIRQPLLKGYGKESNTAFLERAKAGFSATRASLKGTIQDVLAQTEFAYWQVARWQEQLALNESNLKVAEALLEEATERQRVGLVTQIEVLQAEAFRAESREDIIETTRILGDAYDHLMEMMGALPDTDFSMQAGRRVHVLPDADGAVPEFDQTWTMALNSDPALAAQEAQIEQRVLDQVTAKDATRPNLDLVLTGAYSGSDDDANGAYGNAFDRDGHAWSVGLEFSMPWSRREERANQRITDKRLQKEEIRYQALKQSLFRDVRSAWRSLNAVQQSLQAARLTVSLQEASFEREKSKYEQGLSAFRNVLEAQRDLDQARVRLLQSKFTKLSAEIDLANMSGRLFERHGIAVDLPELN